MRYAPRALLAGGLGFAASILVACGGGSGLLSTDQAASLADPLGQLSAALGSGQCDTATTALTSFTSAVENLPGVDPKLTGNLQQGAGVLAKLIHCHTQTTTTSSTTTTSTTTTSSPTITVQSTATETTAPTATTTVPPPPTPGPSPSGGAGLGGGNGNGNGTGNGTGH
jgi:hypothetical protein